LVSITDREWSLYACRALKVEGIEEGIQWLIELISRLINKLKRYKKEL
jgi:hypothetical protein